MPFPRSVASASRSLFFRPTASASALTSFIVAVWSSALAALASEETASTLALATSASASLAPRVIASSASRRSASAVNSATLRPADSAACLASRKDPVVSARSLVYLLSASSVFGARLLSFDTDIASQSSAF